MHYANATDTEVVPISQNQFSNVLSAADIRQTQVAPVPHLDYICSTLPSILNESCDGVHRQCYKKFINVGHLLVHSTHDAPVLPTRSSSRAKVGKYEQK